MAERDPVMLTVKISARLQSLALALDDLFVDEIGEKVTFSLLVWGVEGSPRMSYVSNTRRDDVRKALEALLERWKRNEPDMPAHFQN